MSQPIFYNGFVYGHDQFLTEVLAPSKTDFGVNDTFNNNKWITIKGPSSEMLYTFFHFNNYYYFIGLTGSKNEFEVSFSAEELDFKRIQDLEYLEGTFDNSRKSQPRIAKLLGKLVYIIIRGTETYKINTITFDGADSNLGNFYSKIVKNSNIVDYIEKFGFTQTNNELKFER